MEKLDYYEGQVLDGKFHGKGKLTSKDGIVAEGTFENGRLEGEATLSHPNGNVYLIQVKEGKLTNKKLVKQSENSELKTKVRNPFNVGPGSNPKPKSGGFVFLGLDLGD